MLYLQRTQLNWLYFDIAGSTRSGQFKVRPPRAPRRQRKIQHSEAVGPQETIEIPGTFQNQTHLMKLLQTLFMIIGNMKVQVSANPSEKYFHVKYTFKLEEIAIEVS